MELTVEKITEPSAWNKRLRKIRRTLDMTQQEFSEKLGLKTSAYRMYEIGKNQPSIEVLQKLAQLTGISLDWLLLGKAKFGKSAPFESERAFQILDTIEGSDENADSSMKRTAKNLSNMLHPEELERMTSHFFALFVVMKCLTAYLQEHPSKEETPEEAD